MIVNKCGRHDGGGGGGAIDTARERARESERERARERERAPSRRPSCSKPREDAPLSGRDRMKCNVSKDETGVYNLPRT